MREVFCNTSPLQYLHQLGLLPVLRTLAERIVVPPAVVQELEACPTVAVQYNVKFASVPRAAGGSGFRPRSFR